MNTYFKTFRTQTVTAIKVLSACTLIFGLLYGLTVYGVAHLFFFGQAEGSFVSTPQGEMSLLAGQSYSDPGHLWGRMQKQQAVQQEDGTWHLYGVPADHDVASPDYIDKKEARMEFLKATNPEAEGEIPPELYTWSASGMDPDLSLEAALWQIPRIARASGLSDEEVERIITSHIVPSWNPDGSKWVRVMEVNLELDARRPF